MPHQQLGQESFMNRHLAVPERRDFLFVVIDQDNLVPQIRKTRSRYQTHVPGTDHRDAHSEPSFLEFSHAPPARRRAHCHHYCSSLYQRWQRLYRHRRVYRAQEWEFESHKKQ
jgi:hypothetical protein